MESQREAKAKIYDFLVGVGLDRDFDQQRIDELLGTGKSSSSPNVGSMWDFKSPFGNFSVSARTGHIVFFRTKPAIATGPRLKPDQAVAAARAFIGPASSHIDLGCFEVVETELSDEAYRIEFVQTRQPHEVSIFPNFISIAMQVTSGSVYYYALSDLDFRRTNPPAISERQARQLIKREVSPRGRIDTLQLFEEPVEDATRSITVWSAEVTFESPEGFSSADRIRINADTGEKLK
jgi:hypothetical protein